MAQFGSRIVVLASHSHFQIFHSDNYHCRISENDCEKQEQQFWSQIGPSGESFHDSLSIIITVEYLKMTARSKSNSSGAKLSHLVKVSKIPFQYIPGVLKTGLVKISCFLRRKA